MAFVLSFIAVYGQYFSSITCEGPFCGSWTEAGTVAFLSLYRPLIGCSVFWTIFACVTGNGGKDTCEAYNIECNFVTIKLILSSVNLDLI